MSIGKQAKGQKPQVALFLFPKHQAGCCKLPTQLQAGASPTANFSNNLAFPEQRGPKLALSGATLDSPQ